MIFRRARNRSTSPWRGPRRDHLQGDHSLPTRWLVGCGDIEGEWGVHHEAEMAHWSSGPLPRWWARPRGSSPDDTQSGRKTIAHVGVARRRQSCRTTHSPQLGEQATKTASVAATSRGATSSGSWCHGPARDSGLMNRRATPAGRSKRRKHSHRFELLWDVIGVR